MATKAHTVFKFIRQTAHSFAKDVGSAAATTSNTSLPPNELWTSSVDPPSGHADLARGRAQVDQNPLIAVRGKQRLASPQTGFEAGFLYSHSHAQQRPRGQHTVYLPPNHNFRLPLSHETSFVPPPPPPPPPPRATSPPNGISPLTCHLPLSRQVQCAGGAECLNKEDQTLKLDGKEDVGLTQNAAAGCTSVDMSSASQDCCNAYNPNTAVSSCLPTPSEKEDVTVLLKHVPPSETTQSFPSLNEKEGNPLKFMLSKLHAVEEKSLVLSNQLPLGSCFVSKVLGMGDTKRSQQRQRPCSQSVLLNREIMNAASCQQLLCLVHSKGHLFDFFNISTAISRMPKLVHAAPLLYGDPGAIDVGLGSLKANSLQSPGNLDKVGRELAASLANLMVNQVHLFDARGLANSAWAFAKIRHVPLPGLPKMIAEEAAKKMRDFGAQNISNLAWSFVYMHHRDVYVLDMMAQQILVRLDDFKPQELSNVMWAFASLDYFNSHTLEALSKKAVAMAPYFKEQELSNVIWAFGRLQYNCPHALSALLAEAGAKLHILHPQGVANIAWSMAALWGNQDCDLKQLRARSSAAAALLPGIAAYSRGRLKEFDCQSLSFLCWGLCTLGCSDTRLMDDIVEEAAIRTEALILHPNVFSGMLANRAAMGVPVLHQSHLKSWEATVSRALPTCEEHIVHSLCDSLSRLQGSASLNMPSSSATSYFHSRLSDLQGSSEPASTIRSLSKPFDSHDVGNMQGVTLPEDLEGPWPDYDLCDASQIALPTGLMSLQDETKCLMVVTRKSQDRKVGLGAKVYGGDEIQPEHKLSTDNLVSLPGLGFDTFFKMQDEHVSAPAVGLDDEFGWQHSGCAQDLQRRWLSGLLKNDDLPSWQPGHASGDERECKGVIMGHSGLWEQSSRGPAWMIPGDHLHGGASSRFPKRCLSSSSISSSASSMVLSVEQLLPQHLVAEIGWYH